LRPGEQGIGALADAGVEDGGDVAGSGQVACGDGDADDFAGVQSGEFGGMQGAVQPAGPVGEYATVPGRQRGGDELAVVVVAAVAGFGGPDRVEDRQVVGVGQVAASGLGSGEFGAVAAQDVGQHGDWLAWLRAGGICRICRTAPPRPGRAAAPGLLPGSSAGFLQAAPGRAV
jgi:hypothetical protein